MEKLKSETQERASSVASKSTKAGVDRPSLFEWRDGSPFFRGVRVERRELTVAHQTFRIALLKDAAELLDDPEIAREFIEAGRAPYGLELWPAAIMLAEVILTGEDGGGRPALDLGCGLGLTAMAATVRGWRVVAVDHDPAALRFTEHNTQDNGIDLYALELWDWNRPPADRRFHRVFGADVLYQRMDHVPILRCLESVVHETGSALLTDPRRSVADGFAALATDHGWFVDTLPAAAANFEGRPIQGRVFVLRRRVS